MAAPSSPLVDAINDLLPQTQCRRCGYQGCRPYAEAIASGAAPINRCPPGGTAGISQLAALLDVPPLTLDPQCGIEGPRSVARIEPEHCIGCTKCIRACPVDAIIGASKRMHTIIAELCTGCELCLPPCPVDCIVLEPTADGAWSRDQAARARSSFDARNQRLVRVADRQAQDRTRKAQAKLDSLSAEPKDALTERKRAVIEAAIQRSRERAAARSQSAALSESSPKTAP